MTIGAVPRASLVPNFQLCRRSVWPGSVNQCGHCGGKTHVSVKEPYHLTFHGRSATEQKGIVCWALQ